MMMMIKADSVIWKKTATLKEQKNKTYILRTNWNSNLFFDFIIIEYFFFSILFIPWFFLVVFPFLLLLMKIDYMCMCEDGIEFYFPIVLYITITVELTEFIFIIFALIIYQKIAVEKLVVKINKNNFRFFSYYDDDVDVVGGSWKKNLMEFF